MNLIQNVSYPGRVGTIAPTVSLWEQHTDVKKEPAVLKQRDTTALPVSIGGTLLSTTFDTALLSLPQDNSPFVVWQEQQPVKYIQ